MVLWCQNIRRSTSDNAASEVNPFAVTKGQAVMKFVEVTYTSDHVDSLEIRTNLASVTQIYCVP